MLTVTIPADEFDLTTVAAAREALGVDASEDDTLAALIGRASDVISRHCKRVFAQETVSEQLRLDRGERMIVLARYPVVSITSITEGAVTLDTDDYEANLAAGTVTRLANDRPCCWAAVKITLVYVAGYELPGSAPAALQQACLQLVKAYYVGADRDPMLRSETVDDISSASFHSGDLPPDVQGLLTPFRNLRVG